MKFKIILLLLVGFLESLAFNGHISSVNTILAHTQNNSGSLLSVLFGESITTESTDCLNSGNSPPMITKQPPTDLIFFRVDEKHKSFIIECEAEGFPEPQYRWIKNGEEFNWLAYDDRISQQPGKGTIIVNTPRDEDNGESELNSFKGNTGTLVAEEGKPLKITCNAPEGWPKPIVDWMLQERFGAFKTINSSRITVDPEGTLWFSNVTIADKSIGFNYACSAYSPFRHEYKLGNLVYLTVTAMGNNSENNMHPPVAQYISNKKTIGIRGQTLELWCIVGGTPLPEIQWTRKEGPLPLDRIEYKNYGKTLRIKEIELADSGNYVCNTSNGVGSPLSHSINVVVKSAPYFTIEPKIINAKEGDLVEFSCAAGGDPPLIINWIHNGKIMEEAFPNPRRTIEQIQNGSKIVFQSIVKSDTGNYGCNASNSLGYVYKDVYASVRDKCNNAYSRGRSSDEIASRSCNTSNYRNCSAEWLEGIEKEFQQEEIIDGNKGFAFLEEISNATGMKDKISYHGNEITRILNLSEAVLRRLENITKLDDVEKLFSTAVNISHGILVNKKPWEELNDNEKVKTGTYFIESMERNTFELISRTQSNNHTIVEYRKNFNAFNEILTTAAITNSHEQKIIFPANPSNEESFIELPILRVTSSVEYVGIRINPEYANNIFLPNSTQILNGELMSLTIRNKREIFPDETSIKGVSIRFIHNVSAWGNEIKVIRRKLHVESGERAKAVLGSKDPCVYWDTIELNWSKDGCKLIQHTELETLCECNHLTSFAVLMDVHKYVGKDRILEILTWTLLPISSICLIICIGVYSLSSVKAVRSPRGTVTNQLCICLLVGNILMLIFVDRDLLHLNHGFCTAFGILAHYFYLAAFCWMAFEGYVLYKIVIVVFDDGKDRLTRQYSLAYGIPGIIVLVTFFVSITLEDAAYETDMFCWLNGDYIWAFMGPIAVIIPGNLIMLGISIKKASGLSKNRLGTKRQTPAFFTWVKGTAGLTVLLGITWGFGFFMIVEQSELSNVAAYVFTVFNASQGIFLFIFHIVMNDKIRKAVNRRLTIFCNTLPFKQSSKSTTQTNST